MIRVVLIVAVLAGTATARPASTGFFAEGGLGAVVFLPPDAKNAAVGPTMDIVVGRDLFSWLSLGIYASASSHQATVPPPPENEWFQLYRGGGDLRIGGQTDAIAYFVDGGAGVAMMSSNVLEKVMTIKPGDRFSLLFHAGGGLEYQLENRHYAFGFS